MRREAARSGSNATWLCAVGARWVLAAGLLASFTAAAGNDPSVGVSVAPSYRQAVTPEPRIVAASDRLAHPSPFAPTRPLDLAAASPTDRAPRPDLKAGAEAFPSVEQTGKGWSPIASSLSRRGLELARAMPRVATRLAFAHDDAVLPATVLMPGTLDGPDWTASRRLEPWSGEDPTQTRDATSVQSPKAAAAGSTGAARTSSRRDGDGSTPKTARALVLSSATPAPAEAVPVEIAAAPVSLPHRIAALPTAAPAPLRVEPETRPLYAELIAPDHLDREQRCLAEAVYFEARSEPEDGQAAVAQVVLNRVNSGLYPASVCGVVYQNRHRHLACQFTFACEGKALRITEPGSWEVATRVARDVTEGRTYLADVGGATHYHADYVRPTWARRLKKMDAIGKHVFYKLRPGQT